MATIPLRFVLEHSEVRSETAPRDGLVVGAKRNLSDEPAPHTYTVHYYTLPGSEAVLKDGLQIGDVFFREAHGPYVPGKCPWTHCDGRHLHVICPSGDSSSYADWNVDSRASNCDQKDDRTHRCWIRHGDPAQGALTVDKNGATCKAGAGSIQIGNYHGFVRGFALVDA